MIRVKPVATAEIVVLMDPLLLVVVAVDLVMIIITMLRILDKLVDLVVVDHGRMDLVVPILLVKVQVVGQVIQGQTHMAVAAVAAKVVPVQTQPVVLVAMVAMVLLMIIKLALIKHMPVGVAVPLLALATLGDLADLAVAVKEETALTTEMLEQLTQAAVPVVAGKVALPPQAVPASL